MMLIFRKVISIAIAYGFSLAAYGQVEVTTVAGNGTAGYSGDGGPATAAALNIPTDVVIDGSGNVYIADYRNCRVRRVDISTKSISTVAGSGMCQYSGDGGLATSAGLGGPHGIAIASNGDIYIADYDDGRIRLLDSSSGKISTIAGTGIHGFGGDGGLAIDAQLNHPHDIAVDKYGNVYIADAGNNRIRMIDNSGRISTIVGTGTPGFSGDGDYAQNAQLNKPVNVALDESGNLHIADMNNGRIRRVLAVSGKIETIAGNGTQTYGGDGVLAKNTGLSSPSGLAIDSAGNIYTSDASNRVYRVNRSTGTIDSIVGNGYGCFSGELVDPAAVNLNWPYSIGLDGGGNIYVGDRNNQRILRVGNPLFPFGGFYSPVDNIPTQNITKAGSAIPVKFSIGGYRGDNILQMGYPASQVSSCDAGSVMDNIEETVPAVSNQFSYDQNTGQYIYVWKTKSEWAGSCRQLIMRLIDGSDHRANFRFK